MRGEKPHPITISFSAFMRPRGARNAEVTVGRATVRIETHRCIKRGARSLNDREAKAGTISYYIVARARQYAPRQIVFVTIPESLKLEQF